MKILRNIAACFLLLHLIAGCSSADTGQTKNQIIIYAASSLTNAFMDLANQFETQQDDVEVVLNFASSSQLAAQLIEGGQADLYASANQIQMKNVVDAGLVEGNPKIFTKNQLILLVPKENPARIRELSDLANPDISLILASPATPIRGYSDQIIQKYADADFSKAVYENLVSEEANVRQVVTKITLGEGDVGIVYTSDLTPDIAEHTNSVSIPPKINVVADYPIAQLINSKNPALAQTFIEFILNPDGQKILEKWGFLPLTNTQE
jgi:molybdate transport system substrate-binding protein